MKAQYKEIIIIIIIIIIILLLLLCQYSPWCTLASSKIAIHCSGSCDLHLQLLMPVYSTSSSTDSNNITLDFPTCQVTYGLRMLSFLQRFSSCDLQMCHSHLRLPNLYHFNYVYFIIQCIKLIIVPCSPYTVIVKRTINHSSLSTEALLVANEEIGLEVNAKKSMFLSHEQNAGKITTYRYVINRLKG